MKVDIVIGANFGDEGKGLMTDYLASKSNGNPIVIRANGGSQAGHTVTTPQGQRHVFHHFGSGTFVNAPTYLADTFVADPMSFLYEHEQLMGLGLNPNVIINEDAFLVTPFDIMINWAAETKRGNDRHGSCGHGIHETMLRCNTHYITTVQSINHPTHLTRKLKQCRDEYAQVRINQLECAEYIDPDFYCDEIIEEYVEMAVKFKSLIRVVNSNKILLDFDHLIFEGAQGLLLDQHHQYFPYVTHSNTGIKNPMSILNTLRITQADVYYMTRAYLTRHGAGPLPFEHDGPIYDTIVDETNKTNNFQHHLRFAPFNFDLLDNSISNDINSITTDLDINVHMVVTCVNQLPDTGIHYIAGGRHNKCNIEEFKTMLATGPFPVFLSDTPTRQGVYQHKLNHHCFYKR